MITYKNGEKHGKSYLYHKNSKQVLLEMTYEHGQRQGEAFKYYENGQIYAITPYEDDEVQGIVKLYFRNGNLKAEIPYHRSLQGLGLKEYFTNGQLKTDLPKIRIRNQIMDHQLVYYFSIDECMEDNFFIGSLLNNQYLIEELPFVEILPQQNGEAIYHVPANQRGKTINVICKCRTSVGKNPHVTREIIKLGEKAS